MQTDNFSNFRLFNPIPIYSPEEYASREHFEQFFYSFYLKNRDRFPRDIEYIPVFWHSYENCIRKNKILPTDLQDRLGSLGTNKKYFTVSSHFSGIRYQLPERTTIFTSATDHNDVFMVGNAKAQSHWHKSTSNMGIIKIPLLKHPCQNYNKKGKRSLCNFIGAIDTHLDRRRILSEFSNNKSVVIKTYGWKELHEWEDKDFYPSIVGRSTFTLCPRGFGRTSYRLYESMQLGSVPIYFYDDKFLPYEDEINWKDICIMIPFDRIEDSFRIMKLKTEVDIGEYRENIQKLYKKYFTREGVCEYILRKLNGS